MGKDPATDERIADALESLVELFADYLAYIIKRQQVEDDEIKKGAEVETDLLDF